MDTLLLIEDDNLLRYTLRLKLEKEGYVVLEAINGQRALQILQQHPVNLIMLDMELPDVQGADLLHIIRNTMDIPILVISADPSINRKVQCLDLGADDYLPKPLDEVELSARIRSNLNRYRNALQRQVEEKHRTHITRIGAWRLDRARFDIFNDDNRPGGLTLPEFQLLNILIEKSGKALKREELCHAVRVNNYIPTPRAIDIKITRLRKKLGDTHQPPTIIQTVRGIGYMLNTETLAMGTESLASQRLLPLIPAAITLPSAQGILSQPHLANILLVEDNSADAELTRTLLLETAQLRCNFLIARDGQQALDMLSQNSREQQNVDFILLDINLPGLSGFEVLEYLRKNPLLQDTPVAICTSSTHDKDRARAQKLGVMGFLNKPTTLEALKPYLELAGNIRLQQDGSGYNLIRAA